MLLHFWFVKMHFSRNMLVNTTKANHKDENKPIITWLIEKTFWYNRNILIFWKKISTFWLIFVFPVFGIG